MSSRTSNALAVFLLLVAIVFRLWQLPTLPPGLHQDEINDIRVTETARQGRIEVLYDLGGEGREGLYDIGLSVITSAIGGGLVGYRMLSFWAGIVTLALVYALAKRLYSPFAAVSAMALLSVGMLPILLSRMVARESVLPLLLTGVLFALAQTLVVPRRGARVSTSAFTALGLGLGAGFYLHPTGFMIALMAMLFIAFAVLSRHRLSRRRLGYIGFAIVLMTVVAMPYMISAIRLPELAGARRIFEGFAVTQPTPLGAVINGIGGFFLVGDSNPVFNLPHRPLIDLVSALFLIVGLLVAVRYGRQARFALPVIAALVLTPAALLPRNSPDFRAMAVLLPLVALFFGVGVNAVLASLRGQSRAVFRVGLLVLFLYNLVWTGRDLFTVWAADEQVQTAYNSRIGQLAHYLDTTAGDTASVVCVANLDPAATPDLETYEILALMMHRQNVPIRYTTCGTGLILANGGEREQVIFPEADALFNVHRYIRDWLEQGELLERPDLPPQSVVLLDVQQTLADTVGRFTTTVPVFFAPESPGGMDMVRPPVRFGGNISFLGYEPFNDAAYNPGDYLTLITYWRVDGVVPSDLRLFTHILFDPQTIAAQSDTISVFQPQLQLRDIFIQITTVRLPPVLPSGRYRISIGAYEDNTDVRLNVFDGEQPRGTRLFLDQITVEAE